MIIIDLNCNQGHRFEGWFASTAAFDEQCEHNMVSCPVCSSNDVRRVPSAVQLLSVPSASTGSGGPQGAGCKQSRDFATAYRAAVGEALRHNENVGTRSPEEVCKSRYHEAAARTILGCTTGREVEDLLEEGIDVINLLVYRSDEESD